MDRVYRIIAKNFPADLIERVSTVHAFAILALERAELQQLDPAHSEPVVSQDSGSQPKAGDGQAPQIALNRSVACT